MSYYSPSDASLEDPFLRLYEDITYRERYCEMEDDDDLPWAVYDPD